MEGSYKVEENINFESFLRVMGVTDDAQIEAMIQATKQVTLKNNGDGTWTQESGLKTSTFPINKEYKVHYTKNQIFTLIKSFLFSLESLCKPIDLLVGDCSNLKRFISSS